MRTALVALLNDVPVRVNFRHPLLADAAIQGNRI